MTDFVERARRYHDAIKAIFLNEWDPIGVSNVPEAQDEYDAYIPGIYKKLISRSEPNEIFEYLWDIETVHMGLAGNRKQTEFIVQKLIQLVDKIEGGEEI